MCKEMCKNNSCPMGGKHKTMKSIGLLALRIAVGMIFVYAGWGKLTSMHAGASGMMTKIGMPGSGSVWAYLVGGLEVGGGLMVLLGIYATYAAVWLAIIMVVAMFTAHPAGSPFNSYWTELSLFGSLLALMGSGAGCYRLIKQQCCCKTCKAGMENCCKEGDKKDGGCCGGGCGGCGDKKAEAKM